MNVLVIDNYDSFTYNLVAMIRDLGFSPDVFRNDQVDLDQVSEYEKVLLSPGPGVPDEAGIMKQIIRQWGESKSILGVCLGHQGIAEVYGASLYNMRDVLHGVTSTLHITNKVDKLFRGLPRDFEVTHYHSWAVIPESIPPDIEVTATNAEGVVMAIAHKSWDVRGVQFHPESFKTEHGLRLMKNWLTNENEGDSI